MADPSAFVDVIGGVTINFAKPALRVAIAYQRFLEQRAWQRTKEMNYLAPDEMKEALDGTRRDIAVHQRYRIGGVAFQESKTDPECAEYYLWIMMKDANPTLDRETFNKVVASDMDKINANYTRLYAPEDADPKAPANPPT